ncbi:hypothetical protein EAE99_000851 [Botrytis elliptica]|nr:hypothetical protein EAE99_000851 [Botrytis elliptica]
MCQRQWVRFYCGDLRYAEMRCDKNPAGRVFESCVTRQTSERSRDARGPMGHWDPGLYNCPGRCIDWGRISGKTFGNVNFMKDAIFDKFTWLPCSKEWNDGNVDHLSKVFPNLYPDTALRKSKIKIHERPQKKQKVKSEDIIAKTIDIIDCDYSSRPQTSTGPFSFDDTKAASRKVQSHVVKEAHRNWR